jgi:hypothetical protein
MRKTLWLTAVGAALAATYVRYFRPRHMRLGASDLEIDRPMAGDELVTNPNYITNRAITIDAPPSNVWPWIVQMGEQRGGFYSYDFIDRMLGMKVHSAHRVLPRFQHLEVGESLDRQGNMVVRHVDHGRALVIGPGKPDEAFDSTWAIAAYPEGKGQTRLVSRVRVRFDRSNLRALFMIAVLDLGQLIMERKWQREIKKHAEGTYEKWPAEPAYGQT